MKTIDFAVLIPVYNTEPFELLEAVLSVLPKNQTIEQTYDIWVVDDGSDKEETIKCLLFLKNTLGVKLITLEKNSGTSAALNAGHEAIQNEWIAIMGSSDISTKDRFKLQVEHLIENPDIDVLGTNLYSFKESDSSKTPIYQTSHKYITTLEERSEGWLTNHGTVMYKNKSVKDVGGYKLPGRYQDVDLWKRMYLAGKKIRTLKEITYAWRKANI
jgi:glycosyltransferase involved in cell wall biosynthesis